MNAAWFVARRGQTGNKRYGPVDLNQLRELMDGGRVRGDDLVWREGMSNWQRADQCTELLPAAPAQPQPQGYAPGGYGAAAYGSDPDPRGNPYYDHRSYRRRYRPQSSATWVLPVAIVAGVLVLGLMIFGGALFYVAMGSSSRSSSYSTPSSYNQGKSQPWDDQFAPPPPPEVPVDLNPPAAGGFDPQGGPGFVPDQKQEFPPPDRN
ncbi:MAG TPA: DUF4339 domain-containing protein [Gemmataceae bacterium]|nr:DUF4339 domain-containing protein [Gemmataceae bacterium]